MKWFCWFGLHNYQPETHTAGNGRMFYVYRCVECERMFLFDPFRAALIREQEE